MVRAKRRIPLGQIGRRVLLYLVAGCLLTILVAFATAGWVDVRAASPVTAQQTSGDERWEVWRWDRPGATAVLSVRRAGMSWSPRQATGPPDTPTPGDQSTAWASAQSTNPAGEWLELDYARAVVPKAVHVYETYHPGAITRVTVFNPDGSEAEAWHGTDPTSPGAGGGVSVIPLSASFPVSRVRLYIDSVKVPGWNEVDAVQLVGTGGDGQWARDARASSFYGNGNAPATPSVSTPAPADLVPGWSGLDRPGAAEMRQEVRLIDARGWPMPALWSRRTLGPAAALTTPSPGTSYLTTLTSGSLQPSIGPMSGGSTYVPMTGPPVSSFSVSSFGAISSLPSNLPPPPMPLRPVWPGFLVDTLCFAAALALLRWVASAPGRFVREVS